MTPYQRIAILQQLDFDRDVAEKTFPCSTYTACAGLRNPTHKLCVSCPLDTIQIPPNVVTVPTRAVGRQAERRIAQRSDRDFCACGRSKNIHGRMCRKCQADRQRKGHDA